jgi:hypothetical protein
VADGSVVDVSCAYLVDSQLPGPTWGLLTSTNPLTSFGWRGGHRHVSCIVIVKVVDNLKITENDLLELQNNKNNNNNT